MHYWFYARLISYKLFIKLCVKGIQCEKLQVLEVARWTQYTSKAHSKFATCEFKLLFKPSIFGRHPFLKYVFSESLSGLFIIILLKTIACLLNSHSLSHYGSIWTSLECQCCFWTAGWLVSYLTMWLLTLQLFKNSIVSLTQWKLKLNLNSLSVSVIELLEYRRICYIKCDATAYDIVIKERQYILFKFFNILRHSKGWTSLVCARVENHIAISWTTLVGT
jgi:hypothetical protein